MSRGTQVYKFVLKLLKRFLLVSESKRRFDRAGHVVDFLLEPQRVDARIPKADSLIKSSAVVVGEDRNIPKHNTFDSRGLSEPFRFFRGLFKELESSCSRQTLLHHLHPFR